MAINTFNFESINFPGFFIRHRNSLGELTKMEGPIEDFAFQREIRDPSSRNRGVAFSSVNFRGKYLRHSQFRIRLDSLPTNAGNDVLLLFLQDSTFFEEEGLADPNGRSFRSLNFPDRYLRHRDFHLFVEAKNSPNLAADATFRIKPASVAIDHGTVLIPADD